MAATLRVVGSKFAEDRPLDLDAGWNLVSYLPRQALSVAEALQSIDGQYLYRFSIFDCRFAIER